MVGLQHAHVGGLGQRSWGNRLVSNAALRLRVLKGAVCAERTHQAKAPRGGHPYPQAGHIRHQPPLHSVRRRSSFGSHAHASWPCNRRRHYGSLDSCAAQARQPFGACSGQDWGQGSGVRATHSYFFFYTPPVRDRAISSGADAATTRDLTRGESERARTRAGNTNSVVGLCRRLCARTTCARDVLALLLYTDCSDSRAYPRLPAPCARAEFGPPTPPPPSRTRHQHGTRHSRGAAPWHGTRHSRGAAPCAAL